MPWIEVFSPILTRSQKKEVAVSLVEAISSRLGVSKDMPGIHFIAIHPEDLYTKGGFLSEKKDEPMIHLSVYLPPQTTEKKKEIFRALTNAVSKALNLPEDATHRVSILLHDWPAENMALGGRLMSEQLTAR